MEDTTYGWRPNPSEGCRAEGSPLFPPLFFPFLFPLLFLFFLSFPAPKKRSDLWRGCQTGYPCHASELFVMSSVWTLVYPFLQKVCRPANQRALDILFCVTSNKGIIRKPSYLGGTMGGRGREQQTWDGWYQPYDHFSSSRAKFC